jgi:hypothetical protein
MIQSHDGSARAMEMEEGALLRRLLMWHPPRGESDDHDLIICL